MRGIIVLEGADGTGKTTLARELVARYGAFYIHNGLWPNMWQRHLAAVDLAIKKSQQQLVVIDRLYLSEQIYGDVFRNGPAYDLGARCLDRVLQRHGAMTVLCVREDVPRHLAHFEKLKTERPEKFNNMASVAQRYLDLSRGKAHYGQTYFHQLTRREFNERVDVTTYDMDRNGLNLPEFCEQLASMVDYERSYSVTEQFSNLRNLAGNPATAQYLFIGEGLSPRACRRATPFLWNDEPGAASWLNARLRELNFDETLGLWTNAIAHIDSGDFLPMLRQELSATVRVIALGRVAELRARQLGFPDVRALPHPQWARRFQAHEPAIYRKQLKDALA